MRIAVATAKRGMQSGLTRIGQGVIDLRALLEQKLTQAPMSVKRRAVQVHIVAELAQRRAVR